MAWIRVKKNQADMENQSSQYQFRTPRVLHLVPHRRMKMTDPIMYSVRHSIKVAVAMARRDIHKQKGQDYAVFAFESTLCVSDPLLYNLNPRLSSVLVLTLGERVRLSMPVRNHCAAWRTHRSHHHHGQRWMRRPLREPQSRIHTMPRSA